MKCLSALTLSKCDVIPHMAWYINTTHGIVQHLGWSKIVVVALYSSPIVDAGSGACLEADEDVVFLQRCEEGVAAQTWSFF